MTSRWRRARMAVAAGALGLAADRMGGGDGRAGGQRMELGRRGPAEHAVCRERVEDLRGHGRGTDEEVGADDRRRRLGDPGRRRPAGLRPRLGRQPLRRRQGDRRRRLAEEGLGPNRGPGRQGPRDARVHATPRSSSATRARTSVAAAAVVAIDKATGDPAVEDPGREHTRRRSSRSRRRSSTASSTSGWRRRRRRSAAFGPGYACCTFRGSMVALDLATGAILWKTYMTPEPDYPGNAVWGSSPAIDTKRGLGLHRDGQQLRRAADSCSAVHRGPAGRSRSASGRACRLTTTSTRSSRSTCVPAPSSGRPRRCRSTRGRWPASSAASRTARSPRARTTTSGRHRRCYSVKADGQDA